MPSTFVNILPTGQHTDAATGKAFNVDLQTIEAIVERFNTAAKSANKPELCICFDNFENSQAAGWITDLLARESGLWAQISWTPLGDQTLRGKEFKFVQPKLKFDGNIPVELLGGSLTNALNMTGMVPFPDRPQYTPPPVTTATIANRLGLIAGARLSSILGEIDRLKGSPEAIKNREATPNRTAPAGPSANEIALRNRVSDLERKLAYAGAALQAEQQARAQLNTLYIQATSKRFKK